MLDMEILREVVEDRRARDKIRKDLKDHLPDSKAILEDFLRDPEKGEVLEKIRSIVIATPDVRQANVGEIKRQLNTGAFAPESRCVAEIMVQETILEELL